jgi:signal transduction histidine kinase
LEHGYTTNQDGSGYGLSVVRHIVDAHGWEIHVTDGTDGGTRFEISGIEAR